jgi:hypothetical protein
VWIAKPVHDQIGRLLFAINIAARVFELAEHRHDSDGSLPVGDNAMLGRRGEPDEATH